MIKNYSLWMVFVLAMGCFFAPTFIPSEAYAISDEQREWDEWYQKGYNDALVGEEDLYKAYKVLGMEALPTTAKAYIAGYEYREEEENNSSAGSETKDSSSEESGTTDSEAADTSSSSDDEEVASEENDDSSNDDSSLDDGENSENDDSTATVDEDVQAWFKKGFEAAFNGQSYYLNFDGVAEEDKELYKKAYHQGYFKAYEFQKAYGSDFMRGLIDGVLYGEEYSGEGESLAYQDGNAVGYSQYTRGGDNDDGVDGPFGGEDLKKPKPQQRGFWAGYRVGYQGHFVEGPCDEYLKEDSYSEKYECCSYFNSGNTAGLKQMLLAKEGHLDESEGADTDYPGINIWYEIQCSRELVAYDDQGDCPHYGFEYADGYNTYEPEED